MHRVSANAAGRLPNVLSAVIPANVSYFVGDDESKWASQVSTFAAVSLGNVWPNVQVRLVARGNNVEKFFHVAPHGDLSTIEMHVEGALDGDIELTESGALRVRARRHRVEPPALERQSDDVAAEHLSRWRRQRRHGWRHQHRQRRQRFDCRCKVGQPGTLGGAQPSYGGGIADIVVSRLNGSLTTLLQSTYVGGSGHEVSRGTSIDSAGNVLVAGYSNSTAYPGTLGGAQPSSGGSYDMSSHG